MSWCEDFKQNKKYPKIVICTVYGKFQPKMTLFGKSKPLKIWNFGKNQIVSSWCDDFKQKKKCPKIVICSAYGEFLAENYFFWKSRQLKIWSFGTDVSIYNIKKIKVVFSAYGEF